MWLICREILRVGKWLVKERGDLIKKFSVGGTSGSQSPCKLSPETPLLLAGFGVNGLRASELEHTFQRGEEVWKKLQPASESPIKMTNGDTDPDSMHSQPADLLQYVKYYLILNILV